MAYLLLLVGFVILIKGADLLVEGASSGAKRLGIPPIVIGLTIVAFGTSMPELIVNIFASTRGNTDIAIGNILGSNIANILLILGISATIYPLAVKRSTTWKEIPLSLLAAVLVAFMANDAIIDGGTFSALTRIDGLVLLSFFIIFLYYIYGLSQSALVENAEAGIHKRTLPIALLMTFSGLICLTLGGKWVVDSAIAIAKTLGISESLIGLTIVAIGTSLPELATSAVAAYKKNADIAVGNIVGSNIFNIFWILGISATITPLPFAPILLRDIFMTILASLLLFIFMFIGKKHLLERWQGVGFILIYLAYIALLVTQELGVS